MFTVLQRHVSTHMSHLQARNILVYKVTVLILGSQTLTCLFNRCYLLYFFVCLFEIFNTTKMDKFQT